ncbi:TonB-dependent receptor [Ameyamaea chiangmaiensis]|uniref:TonB-dependent receptor n=1 Tax=Ameyamaea chiangmaiensis TaxID=442969 RepID=A0A850PBE2_9PROT|nr:TonB-dependent receptor [Ameyamaea chiangmaiensis]MBS4075568.1 TonB-dependent receptor [Ameyamaea chiangmaiensis]NVN40253.1 TonB-dependent receptor [Ameyamaea chiangmaiensis]
MVGPSALVRAQDAVGSTHKVIPTVGQTTQQQPVALSAAAKEETILVRGDVAAALRQQPGGGLIRAEQGDRSVSSVDREYISRQPPTATAFQLISSLPGATVSTSDPFGFSPYSDLTVRGLGNDAIGYVLEGMPLNDVAYYTGYPSQFADTENYDSVSLEQGSADLDSPVLNAAGGLMTLAFRDPSPRAGGYVGISYGSYDTNREFLRLETGEIGHTGIRGFVSYSHGATDNWRGPGRDTRQHVDFKFLKSWGADSHAAILGSWNSTITSYYPQPTLASWKEEGIGGANNLAASYNINDAEGGTDYWRLWRAPERTLYVGAPVHLSLTGRLSFDVTPYSQFAYGNVPGGSMLSESGLYDGTQPLGAPLVLPDAVDGTAVARANYTQRSYRSGFNAALHYRWSWNDLVLGYWYDYSDDNEQDSFTPVTDNGYAPDIWAETRRDTVLLSDGRPFLAGSQHAVSQTNALFIGDHIALAGDRLTIDAGFKAVMLTRGGVNAMPGPQYRADSSYFEPLPRVGMRWRLDQHSQIFLNGTTNFRAPASNAFFNLYDPTSGAIYQRGVANTKPEYSISEELGYRYSDRRIVGSLTLFNYNFTNRQIATELDVNGSLVQSTINAGGQTSRGVDVEVGTRPWHHVSLYGSGEYLHATIDNDIASAGDVLPTRGKTAVRSPPLQASIALSYDDGHVFGIASVKYVGHQYASFMNDERIPDHTTGDLSFGYHFSDISRLHAPTLRMNFVNITNQHYLSGVASPSLNAQDTTGRLGTTIAGSAPAYYIAGGFAALFTASTGF